MGFDRTPRGVFAQRDQNPGAADLSYARKRRFRAKHGNGV